eukprot:GHVT01036511.1.p1 GENE.GHVT01036511.1~~GHVT01036511.1.p1  ORF type:complete len:112 (-),score=13.65 GHVT01036511.1:47-382(-)
MALGHRHANRPAPSTSCSSGHPNAPKTSSRRWNFKLRLGLQGGVGLSRSVKEKRQLVLLLGSGKKAAKAKSKEKQLLQPAEGSTTANAHRGPHKGEGRREHFPRHSGIVET